MLDQKVQRMNVELTTRNGRRIFVLSEIFHPETTSTGYYLTSIAERLSQSFKVQAICADPAEGPTLPRAETYRRVQIERLGRMSMTDMAVHRRALGAFSRALRMFFRLLRRLHAGDIVLTVTNPPLLPPLVALGCLLKRTRLVLLVHDIYPDAAVAAGVLNRGSVGARIWGGLQRWVYRRADRIICLGRDARALIVRKEPRIAGKLAVIPNWAETDTVQVSAKKDSSFALSQRVRQRFVVLYAGNLGRTHDPDLIIDAARLLERQYEILFLIVATGSQFSCFAAAVECGARPNLVAVPLPGSRDQQSDTLAAGDVVLITFKSGMGGVSVPSRMYNAMAAGKPLIGVTESDSELAFVIREEAIGWVVQPGDAAALARAISEARADPDRLKQMGLRARVVAETKYSRQVVLAQYASLVESLANESSPS